MADAKKPIPVPNEDSMEYWAGCREGRLMLQQCEACGHVRFYPRILCTACGKTDTRWIQASGKGTVYTYTVVHRAPSAAFKEDVPYVLALVELDEGPRMMTNLVDTGDRKLEIGMPVSVVFEKMSDEISVPKFKPAGEP